MSVEPWVLLRLAAGLIALCLFARSAWVAARVLRFSHVASSGEGQLALERQAELSATAARVGAAVQVLALVLTVVVADRMTPSIRGAMCGYGVVHANEAGPLSVAATIGAALAAGAYWQLLRLDRAHRSLALLRPVSWGALIVACSSALDFGFALEWLGGLDLKAVASCCSTGVDEGGEALARGAGGGARAAATAAALALVPSALGASLWAARRGGRGRALAAGLLSLAALPAAAAAVVLEVAPHVYEVPHHRCPYCLFRADAWGIGYPLFGALFVAAVAALGTTLGALLTLRSREASDPFPAFARERLGRAAAAFAVALALGAAPVLRYAIVSGGASLFAGAP
ncbi:MAG TPA: hypothetical protein VFS43_19330 [Polyangiaceae bacterium]|nr:hypothetical protein [Polyangiaceae bacterium]